MCKMLAVAISNGSLLPDLIKQHDFFFKPPESFEPDGFGYGYYIDDRPLLSKQPRGATPHESYYPLVKDLNTNLFMLHARQATVGGWKDANTHPFRLEPWLFAHTGTAELLQEKREHILQLLPNHLKNNIKGDTDSELLFMLILSNLGDLYKMKSIAVSEEKALDAIRKSFSQIGYSFTDFNEASGVFFLTNGNLLIGVSCGGLLQLRVQSVTPPSYPKKSDSSPGADAPFKAVMMAVSDKKAVMGFEPIEPGEVVIIHRSLEIIKTRLDEQVA